MEPPGEYLPGHAELAAYISIDPDFQIYKRFTRLSARNLLYLQSELASLSQWFEDFDRAEQQRLESTSMEEKMDVLYRTQSWSAFMSHADKGGRPDASEEDRRQAMKLRQIERLRKATAEYRSHSHPSYATRG
jgi:N-formylglutamate amidohydrolase